MGNRPANTRPTKTQSRVDVWALRINRWPRLTRVIVSLAVTVILTLLAWLLLAEIFGLKPLDAETDATLPLLLDVGVALFLYALGWWALVGFDLDPNRPWQAGSVAVLYVAAGVAGAFILIMLFIFGLAFGYIL